MSQSVAEGTAQSRGPAVLAFIQTFSTLGFAVLYSTLVLYATKQLGFSDEKATLLMGVFGAFNYGLHLFGGFMGGRLLSNRNLFVAGMLLQVVGCYLISDGSVQGLYWGLAMFLTGSGLNVTCINMMLTQRFTPDDPKREGAFLWNYAGMNLGFFIGFAVSGSFQLSGDYSTLFHFATLGNLAAVVISLFFWRELADISTPLLAVNKKQWWQRFAAGIVILAAFIPVLKYLLKDAAFSNSLVIGLGVVVLLFWIAQLVFRCDSSERRRLIAYLILAAGSLMFWALYQLAPMGLTLFVEHNVNMQLWGVEIAPQWVQNINTVVIVVGGPLLARGFMAMRKRGVNIDIPAQFASALVLMGLGMLAISVGIGSAAKSGMVPFFWVALSYVLQSLGELLISPIGYAMIGKLAPARYQGMMMGSWMMVTGVASVLASKISAVMPQQDTGLTVVQSNPGYLHVFNGLGVACLALALILIVLIPTLRRLIPSKAA